MGNGRPALELLLAKTDPKLVNLELDVGWVTAAGVDPADFLRRHRARITQIHLKDLKATPANTSLALNTTDVGQGVQDWDAIFNALKGSAVAHAYMEQEQSYNGPGLDVAARAYAFLQPLMAKHGV